MRIKIIQNIIDLIRQKKPLFTLKGEDNIVLNNERKIDFAQNCKISVAGNNNLTTINHVESCSGFLTIKIVGNNNIVKLNDCSNIKGNLYMSIYGDNNLITIGQIKVVNFFAISTGQPNHPETGKTLKVINNVVDVGDNTSIAEARIEMYQSNTQVKIGKDCMFSSGISLYHTDGHPVLDLATNKILSKPRNLIIGNHCWICHSVIILKNSIIPDGCIVGRSAVVAKQFTEKNTVIAGNPARVLKHGVTWAPECEGFIENEDCDIELAITEIKGHI